MIITNLRNKINYLLPNAIFDERGNDYDSIVWNDPREKPTLTALKNVAKIEGDRPNIMRRIAAVSYKKSQAAMYRGDITALLNINSVRSSKLADVQSTTDLASVNINDGWPE